MLYRESKRYVESTSIETHETHVKGAKITPSVAPGICNS